MLYEAHYSCGAVKAKAFYCFKYIFEIFIDILSSSTQQDFMKHDYILVKSAEVLHAKRAFLQCLVYFKNIG